MEKKKAIMIWINSKAEKAETGQNNSLISTKKDGTVSCSGEQTNVLKEQSSNLGNILDKEKPIGCLKRKKNVIDQLSNTEETVRMERIKRVMDQEQQLAHVKQKHEENISSMKESHLKEIYSLELQHLKVIQSLEIDIKRAQLKEIESKK
ncbi:uncharacterized protein LOC105286054 [Ooceraea biroi]|uniref:uncharacterized protein LOC105286054 n=1 Tax=Ooceraea biroi TaxID=2015173 RepID=UPI000F089D91|nr:uncharacterized protein LOC105286054 [Ooceraea biroi]